jgi:hypothetical protein
MTRNDDRKWTYGTQRSKSDPSDQDPFVEQLWEVTDDGEKLLVLSECDEETGLLQDRRENDRWMESDIWMEVEA